MAMNQTERFAQKHACVRGYSADHFCDYMTETIIYSGQQAITRKVNKPEFWILLYAFYICL